MFEIALSYDDVLLLPGYSEVLPRDCDIKTKLCADVHLNIPIISAAMDTVTEEKLAIAIALEGGAGVIHRNLSPEDQARQASNVKRYLNWIIENPVCVKEKDLIGDVKIHLSRFQFSSAPVLGEGGKLVGIITGRDLRFCKDDSLTVGDVMPKKLIVEREEASVESAREKFDKYKIEKLPVVNDQGELKGLITVKDMEKRELYPNAATDKAGRLVVGAAVSPQDYKDRLPLLMSARVDFVVMDTAHGDSKNVMDAIKDIKKTFSIPVIGGNVVTREGTRRLIEAGADAVKVGIGPGSICTTRVVAGAGMPQFTAIWDCAEEAAKEGIPIIADGGIKFSGDIPKAIGAGADVVMIGNLFAGLKEAPGEEILFDGRIYKEYRGMGSLGAIHDGSADRYQAGKDESPVPEGIEGRLPYRGELKEFVYQLITGLRKGMGYCGCKSLAELKQYRKFVRITTSGIRESHPHDIVITQDAPNYSGA
jgi:IMP dehydrogenase